MVPRLWLPLCFVVCLLGLGGCARRTITVTSEPAGALVWLNDEEVGRTPVTVPFTFYGTYDVRLQRDGYEPLWTERKLEAPLWELPGPDLIAEAVGAEAHFDWHFELQPRQMPSEAAIIDRALQMRATLRENPPE